MTKEQLVDMIHRREHIPYLSNKYETYRRMLEEVAVQFITRGEHTHAMFATSELSELDRLHNWSNWSGEDTE